MPLGMQISASPRTAPEFDPKQIRAVLRSAGAEIAAVARRARVRSLRSLGSAQSPPDPVDDPFERKARPDRCDMMTHHNSLRPSNVRGERCARRPS
jgi:hypothetical protein